jgi:hypothetical protein
MLMKRRNLMVKGEIKNCSSCGSAIYRFHTIKITTDGKIYCSKCESEIPKNKDVIFEGFLRGIFCSECDKIVLEDKRKNPDVNDRVFCSDEHRDKFYQKVETCECCGIEI